MVPKHIAKLRSVNAGYQKVEALERELICLLSGHLGIDVSIVNQSSDGICIDIGGDYSRLTQLSEGTLTEIMSLPSKDAIKYIQDRSI